ncbi:MAG: SRPBCC family protein [Candidatus Thorarchaeota archaeon]
MAKVESKIEIKSTPKRIYEVLTNPSLITKWNITIKELNQLSPDKHEIKSTIGNFISTVTERVENERISFKVDNPDYNAYGYVLEAKGDITELFYWADYENVEHEKILKRYQIHHLNHVKKFIDFLEDGGDPDNYDKSQILVSP